LTSGRNTKNVFGKPQAGRLKLLALTCGLLSFCGCPSRDDSAGIAGTAYVEDKDGNLIPAGSDPTRGVSAGIRPPAGSEKDWLTEFELTERSGKVVSSRDLKGQPYILSFFFSTCPTICTRQNELVKQLQQKFSGQPVRLVSITCDPDVDQPEVLSIYADRFGADPTQWLFLTGQLDYIRRVGAEMFFVPVDRRFHADKFFLVDATGQTYASYAWPEDSAWQELLTDVQKMLDAGGRLPPKQIASSSESELDDQNSSEKQPSDGES
jgi:protein SCO1/2